jgi:hypothetical protein
VSWVLGLTGMRGKLTRTEAYRLTKQAFDDPMANYKDTEE